MISTLVVGTAFAFVTLGAPAAPNTPAVSIPSPGGAEDPSAATSGTASSAAPPPDLQVAPVAQPAPALPAGEDGGPVPPGDPEAPDASVPLALESPAPGAPLPAPAPAVPAASIAHGPWRGTMWFSFLGTLAFPLAGEAPARGDGFATLGGFFQAGIRPLPWLGVGVGVGTQPHERLGYDDGTLSDSSYRRASFFDLPIVRLYLPTQSVFEPYAEAHGGLTFVERLSYMTGTVGGHAGAGAGLNIWAARNVSLNLSARYRVVALDGAVGHQLATLFGFTIHR